MFYLYKTIFFIFCLLVYSCGTQNGEMYEYSLLHKSNPKGKYGDNISLDSVTSIHDLLTYPNKYETKQVLISGKISEVCPMRGCWVNVIDESSSQSIRIKVIDGDIVFPLSAQNHLIKAQGIFKKLTLNPDDAKSWKIHLAEEKGITLNPDSVRLTSKDLIEYRLYSNSAIIK